ncbi:MAG: phage tail assembly protein T [Janthinobacterium lividum]
MPYAEYLGWQEFYALEPWGTRVWDNMQAHITSTLANVNRDTKTRPKPFTLAEFLLYPDDKPAEVAPVLLEDKDAQTEAMIAAMFGGMKNVLRVA